MFARLLWWGRKIDAGFSQGKDGCRTSTGEKDRCKIFTGEKIGTSSHRGNRRISISSDGIKLQKRRNKGKNDKPATLSC